LREALKKEGALLFELIRDKKAEDSSEDTK
jgi:hypothetical protein